MAYTVTLYTDYLNSDTTKRPETALATTNCVWKQGTALLSPTFLVGSNVGTIQDVTYVYIDEWDRYYKVVEIRFMRTNVYELDCEVDVLKSWSNTIKASSQYVLRSASSSNGRVNDVKYPIISWCVQSHTPLTHRTFTNKLEDGTFIVGVSGTAALTGGISYYGMTAEQFGDLIDLANSKVFTGSTIADWSAQAIKGFVDPFKYIQSVIWLPYETDRGSGTTVTYGPFGALIGATGDLIETTTSVAANYTFPISKHPQSEARGLYLCSEPYSDYYVYVPCFGSVKIPSDLLISMDYLYAQVVVDKITGSGFVRFYLNPQVPDASILTVFGQVGIPIAVSKVNSIREAIGGIASTVSGLLGGNVAQAMTSAAGVASTLFSPTPTVTGSTGSIAQFDTKPLINAVFHRVADEDNTHNGRPLCQTVTLSTLSGYCQTMNAHIHAGTAPESEEIERFMNGGFYLE